MEMRIPSIDRTMVVIYYKQKMKGLCRLEIYYFYLKTFDFKLFIRKPILFDKYLDPENRLETYLFLQTKNNN